MATLPNSCALSAIVAHQYLYDFGVESKILRYQTKKYGYHVILLFFHNKRLRGYDVDGSITFPKSLTMESKPLAIARAWAKENKFKNPIESASWY